MGVRPIGGLSELEAKVLNDARTVRLLAEQAGKFARGYGGSVEAAIGNFQAILGFLSVYAKE